MKGIAYKNYVYLEKFSDTLILAKDRKSGEKVAIKSWREDDLLGTRETKIWKDYYSELFVETNVIAGKRILVRKWIEGDTLLSLAEDSSGISKERAAEVLLKLLDAVVDFQDRTNMFLGDIMPSNIIITKGVPKLVDFEMASIPGDDETSFFSKKKTMNFGTPYYCAPEIIMGEGSLKSDVYSLGMIFLFLITGEPNKARIGEIENKYGSFIKRATDINSENRFENAREMKNMLISLIEKTPVLSENNKVEPKLKLISKSKSGYRKSIIYVRNNPSFVSELSYVFSHVYGLKTCAFETCDFDDGRLLFYLETESQKNKMGMLYASEEESEYIKSNEQKYTNITFSDNLYYSSCKIDVHDYLDDENLRNFMSFAYDNFDITIVCDSLSETSSNHMQFMRVSDQVIVAVDSDLDESEREIRYYEYFFKKNKLSTNKIKVVGLNFDENISSDVELTSRKMNVSFIGYICKNDERKKYVNQTADFFIKKMGEKEIEEYCKIIERIL